MSQTLQFEDDLLAAISPPGDVKYESSLDLRPRQTRRLVACKSCHSLKVKCTPANPDDPSGPCLRCLNANRQCEIDLSLTRKRRKKESDPKNDQETIAKLQKKIDKLEKMLGRPQQKYMALPDVLMSDLPPFISKNDLERELSLLLELLSRLLDLTNGLKETADRRQQLLTQNRVRDVVLAGHMTEQEAAERLELYRTKIYPTHPFVEIPAHYGVAEMRRHLPFLLNLIVSITNALSGSELSQDRALVFDNFAVEALLTEVLGVGAKLVELIQALLILCVWYNSPELFRQRRYHMLNTLLVLMLHDLGIVSRPNHYYNTENGMFKMDKTSAANEVSIEYRSLVLVLYFSTVSICLILRRSVYVKWTPYVEECCQMLEALPEARYNNLALFSRLSCHLDKIHHIVHSQDILWVETPSTYVIQLLQQGLLLIKTKISKSDHRTLAYYYSVEAYLHEPNLGKILENHSTGEAPELGARLIRSISSCTNSCLNALEEFYQLCPEEVITIPFFYALRIVYTAGMLLRLRFLILLLPLLIEKDLVPQKAIFAIQNVNRLLDTALEKSSHNYFLRKTRLVLQLFIQTYTSQVQELLKKNGATPQNFNPHMFTKSDLSQVNQLGKLYSSAKETGNYVLSNGNAEDPLPVLLYATSVGAESDPASQMRRHATILGAAATQVLQPPVVNQGLQRAATINNFPPPLQPSSSPMYSASRHNSGISDTLPEQLETLYLALNDEFWADLLSQDNSDKVNFSNNMNNGGLEEVFFTNRQ